MELLKRFHIPFRYKVQIQGKEVDFIIGDTAVEIDGHPQSPEKNRMLIAEGYNLLHLNSWEIPNQNLEIWLRKEYASQRKTTKTFIGVKQILENAELVKKSLAN